MTDEPDAPARIGANEWLVDEMFDQYRNDPSSVSESWQDFFADYSPTSGTVVAARASAGAAPTDTAAPTLQATPATNSQRQRGEP